VVESTEEAWMAGSIEVRVAGRGTVRNGEKTEDSSTGGHCDLCGQEGDATVSMTPDGSAPFGCKVCLRTRLEAITVALWMHRDDAHKSGLPWGKVTS
jgi:hypothetical protein